MATVKKQPAPQQDLGGGGNPPWGLDERRPPETPPGIWVRASIDLPHLRRGDHAYVNPAEPEVEKALRATWLVPISSDWQLPDDEPDPPPPAHVDEPR